MLLEAKRAMHEDRDALRKKISNLVSMETAMLQDKAFDLGSGMYYDAHVLINTIGANVDNSELTDAEFREFVRNSLR